MVGFATTVVLRGNIFDQFKPFCSEHCQELLTELPPAW